VAAYLGCKFMWEYIWEIICTAFLLRNGRRTQWNMKGISGSAVVSRCKGTPICRTWRHWMGTVKQVVWLDGQPPHPHPHPHPHPPTLTSQLSHNSSGNGNMWAAFCIVSVARLHSITAIKRGLPPMRMSEKRRKSWNPYKCHTRNATAKGGSRPNKPFGGEKRVIQIQIQIQIRLPMHIDIGIHIAIHCSSGCFIFACIYFVSLVTFFIVIARRRSGCCDFFMAHL